MPGALDLPPLLTGRRLDPATVGTRGTTGAHGTTDARGTAGARDDNRAFARAASRARDGRLGAGDLVWVDMDHRLEMALVTEPDVARERCAEMVPLFAVACGDALGALAPPEVAVTYRWPDRLLVNGAEAGRLALALANGSPPDWLVVGLHLAVRPADASDPGLDPSRTTLWDEGCGEIAVRDLVSAIARHTVAVLHDWDTGGFGAVHRAWTGRHAGEEGFLGLDDHGNALMREGDRTVARDLIETMAPPR